MYILKVTLYFVFSLSFLFPFTGRSEDLVPPRHYVCYKTTGPLNIDGKALESCWQKVPWTDDFIDILGDKAAAPRFQTHAKMVWNNEFLYVFAEISEPHIWANVKNRDETIYVDNDFEVFIDPDGDTHNYWEYEMNALNTQWDLLLTRPYKDGGKPVTSLNINGVKSAVHLEGTLNNPLDIDRKWSLEIAFPIKSLNDSTAMIPVKPGDQWRVNFSRVEWQTKIENGIYVKVKDPGTGKPLPEDNWVWSPQGAVNMHIPDKWGFLQFSGIEAGKGVSPFIPNPEDEVKDELRLMYSAQQKYRSIHHQYAGNLNELLGEETKLTEFKFNPILNSGVKGYEFIARRQQSPKVWHINETGRIWSEKQAE